MGLELAMRIDEVIVVEGKHDVDKLKAVVDADFIITNGSEISKQTLDMISEISKRREIIIFTDPDFQGERIRKIIAEIVPHAKHAFIEKSKAQGKRNLGVENASVEDLREALGNLKIGKVNTLLTWKEFLSLGITTDKNPKLIRNELSKRLHLGIVNNKQLYKRLNMFGYTKNEIINVIKEIKKDFND
jgi:ribonuclease M5